ncbi:hypothetical protein A2U01_0100066, partial [Trifolium medium]|nr:hypothetical protein [Trifolium medium]
PAHNRCHPARHRRTASPPSSARHRRVTAALQRVKFGGLVVVGARLRRSDISVDGVVGLQGGGGRRHIWCG